MRIFVDTSGLLAVLDASDRWHPATRQTWEHLLTTGAELVTTSYVLVELYALAQRRLGMEAVRTLYTDIQPVLTVLWVDEAMHRAGVEALLGSGRRGPSLVDCVSFVAMRQEGIVDALALDAHFAAQGFRCHPEVSLG